MNDDVEIVETMQLTSAASLIEANFVIYAPKGGWCGVEETDCEIFREEKQRNLQWMEFWKRIYFRNCRAFPESLLIDSFLSIVCLKLN